jgi:uncharacterized protein YndB with AHSA1/START domain
MSTPSPIRWPPHYRPENCAVHVRNELDMKAPRDRIWACLVRATLWPDFYENAKDVKILDGHGPDLQKETRFTWKTFDLRIESKVLEYVPEERIAWDARGLGFDGYHAWVLTPSEKGCHVLTEETQHGSLARLQKFFMPKRMSEKHQMWLTELEKRALCPPPA